MLNLFEIERGKSHFKTILCAILGLEDTVKIMVKGCNWLVLHHN